MLTLRLFSYIRPVRYVTESRLGRRYIQKHVRVNGPGSSVDTITPQTHGDVKDYLSQRPGKQVMCL